VALAELDTVLVELDVFARLRQIAVTDRIATSIAATSGISR
jgi:hypothetical protein